MSFRHVMTGPGVERVEREICEVMPPAAGEVQVRLQASSLNFHDAVTLKGLIPWIEYPRVPLSDGAGDILAVGDGVDSWVPGDRVITLFYPRWHDGRPEVANKRWILGETVDGCAQEILNIDARSVVRAPRHLDAAQSASLVCAGHTAWYALFEEWRVQAGQTVLVQGTGGVSLFALQLARSVGANVVATSSSNEKLERLRQLGANHVINYQEQPDWDQAVMALTGGVDAVIDVGGEATLGKSVACANTDAFIAVIGVLGGFGSAQVSIFDVMQKNLSIKGITVGCGESLARMCRHIEHHAIVPEISHRLPLDALAEGLALMEAGEHFGKVALDVI
ncbi:MAG: NAD(P)-dependent alcohol dehydrogenase [Pseudomonadota bacterium]